MAELEKKYSDYQTSECKDLEQPPEIKDVKICPTCELDPSFTLESDWWEIKKAYLNRAVCEYRVRVYESEALTENPTATIDEVPDVAIDVGILKILAEYGKPFNDGIKIQLKNAASIVETYYNTGSQLLGVAYLVSIPAFNFDQLPQDEDEAPDSEDLEEEAPSYQGKEFILNYEGLFRKLHFLNLTLKAYAKYYSMAQHASDSFVIRQKDDIVLRINYNKTSNKLKMFMRHLSDHLSDAGYPKLGLPGFFKRKAAKRIKFSFKESDKPFDLEDIYVMSRNCPDKYEKLNVSPTDFLRGEDIAVIYNFLENLEEVYNDITAEETKPWLQWTLDHFYPEYIVDKGNLEDTEDARVGLECLLEEQLGLGGGRVVDSLSREIMSAFDLLEVEFNIKSCRELSRLDEANKMGESTEPLLDQERKEKILERYKKEFENKAYDYMVNGINEFNESTGGNTVATRQNVLKLVSSESYRSLGFDFVRVEYSFKNKKTKQRTTTEFTALIDTEESLKENAVKYAHEKFIALEQSSFGDQIANSPYYNEAIEASKEVYKTKGGFIDDLKDSFSGVGDFDPLELIPIIGLCGITKTAGKALDCVANGVSFDDFLDIMISKSFEFMKMNTLDLFYNQLPYEFRENLQNAISIEFGPDVDLSDLFGIKMVDGGDEKLKDFIRSKFVAKRIKELFEKYEQPWIEATDQEKEYIESNLGTNTEKYEDIKSAIDGVGFDRKAKIYPEEKVMRPKFTKSGQTGASNGMKEFKRDKWVLKFIKFVIRDYKIRGSDFIAAVSRISSSMGKQISEVGDYISDRLEIRKTIRDNRKLIDAEKELFDNLLKTQNIVLAEDGTILSLPTSDIFVEEEGYRILQRVKDLSQVEASLYDSLEDTSLSTLAQQKIDQMQQALDEFSTEQGYRLAIGILEYRENFFGTLEQSAENIAPDFVVTGEELNKFEKAKNSFEETALGVKVDIVFDIVFDYVIDAVLEEFSLDELFEMLKSYPIVNFGLDLVSSISADCPNNPIIYPPPGDFLKSLSVDICDPSISLALPVVNIPSIDWRYQLTKQFTGLFTEAILKLASEILIKLVSKLLVTLEGSLCNLIESAGGLVAPTATNEDPSKLKDKFFAALNEAFCNDGENPTTSRKKAEELADALFSPVSFNSGVDPLGSGAKVAGIIGSVASTDEMLSAMVSREGEEDPQFNTRIANAVNVLAPEMNSLLGSPSQVAYFFSNLGSHLSPADRERIRDLLDAGIPSLPVSNAICLTNQQLDDWNNLRNNLLQSQGLTPDEAAKRVADLNKKIGDTLEEIMDTIGNLQGDQGEPFKDALENETDKDPCNPDNVLDVSAPDPVTAAVEEQLVESFYGNISDSLMRGMTGRNSILGEALKDFQGRREFGRILLKLFQPNYDESQIERDLKFDSKGKIGQFVMEALTENNQVIGQYPKTVAISQRDKILEDSGKSYNFSYKGDTVKYTFVDAPEDSNLSFTQEVIGKNNRVVKNNFNYVLQTMQKINDQPRYTELRYVVPVSISDEKNEYMTNHGFLYKKNQERDIRSQFFNKFANKYIPLQNKDYSSVYQNAFEKINRDLINFMMTDPRETPYKPAGIPIGYLFGYISEDLDEDSFIYYNPDGSTPYNLEETEKQLGKFGSDRIIPLDPAIYGGRYGSPPYYVEPRQFFGWMELSTKSFKSPSGCDPKQPPLISFDDIKQRTKDLGQQLKEDPRLSQSPECTRDVPFHLILDKKTKAKLDGVVRTTLRTYIVEYFFKSYGLLSNVELTSSNFDQGLFLYIVNKMKSEMYDLGTSFSSGRITIVKEKYWYTFLEQCVEAYQRTIDVDGVTPPDEIYNALNYIQKGLDLYTPIDDSLKKKMRKRLQKNQTIYKPSSGFDPLEVMAQGPVELGLQAIAFRLTTDPEEKENFFNGGSFEDYSAFEMRFASIKKLNFFNKIYFIAMFEKQAIMIMSELIRQEMSRLYSLMIDGIKDKPNIKYLDKAFLSLLPGSTSRIGFSEYYLEKQTNAQSNPGDISEISQDTSTSPIESLDAPQFIIEKYAVLKNKEVSDLPSFIRNRSQKYVGKIPLSNLSEFVGNNLDLLEDNYLSDFFGDLKFTYKSSIKSLFDKGFTSSTNISRLNELNDKEEVGIIKLTDARNMFISSRAFDDFEVIHDETFLLEGEIQEPFGTTGSTGVKYGLRLSLALPQGSFSQREVQEMRQNITFMASGRNEKCFLFDDDTFILPLVSEEVDVVDTKFIYFDPFSGTERYDLECLINKMVEKVDFKLMMENIFNIKQCSSMLSVYCMETLMPAMGRKVVPEDAEDPNDSENYERAFGRESDPEDDWDGTINKFGKNFLRREFKSMYLSRSTDGLATDNDDDDGGGFGIGGLFAFGNPFDIFTLPSVRLPWWMRLKMKTKVYDANGMECANPKKDLE